VPRAVEFDEYHTLPGSQDELAASDRDEKRYADHGGKKVIRKMRRIMRVAVIQTGDDLSKGIQHIEISSRIEISNR